MEKSKKALLLHELRGLEARRYNGCFKNMESFRQPVVSLVNALWGSGVYLTVRKYRTDYDSIIELYIAGIGLERFFSSNSAQETSYKFKSFVNKLIKKIENE